MYETEASDPMVTKQQTLALAAVLECCILVQRMAKTGGVDENRLGRMVRTALNLDTPDPETLYGGVDDLRRGLDMIADVARARLDPQQIDVLRMTIAALKLQGSLKRNQACRERLGAGLLAVNRRNEDVPFSDELYFSLNEIYTDTLSPLRPRIVVKGSHGHLQNAVLVAKVRSALLAAVRNAYLWHQLGGRQWKLVLLRSRYAAFARGLRDMALARTGGED